MILRNGKIIAASTTSEVPQKESDGKVRNPSAEAAAKNKRKRQKKKAKVTRKLQKRCKRGC